MRRLWQYGSLWTLVLSTGVHAQDNALSPSKYDSVASSSTSLSTSIAQPTCHSGTVNYITHTLPQQCLPSSQSAHPQPTPPSDTRLSDSGVGNDALSVPPPERTQDSSSLSVTAASVDSSKKSTLASCSSVQGSTTSILPPSDESQPAIPTGTVLAEVLAEVKAEVEAETETDSPLDNANFLSFDDWKKQNLVKAGQSPDHVGQQRSSGDKQGRARPGIDNALDVLGEDSEIELDFSGFGAGAHTDDEYAVKPPSTLGAQDSAPRADKAGSSTGMRSKDAGKTCKERSNYASFDCAATVVKSNPECRSASSILIENKDSYMLNTCSVSNKFFIVELCDDILIDTVVLANYEFFSSIFRTFRLSVSDRYPVKAERWRDLGIFEARNARGVQAFLVEQPLIWARYLRVEFLSHYGNEYYCPVSLIRVHGTTMMAEFRHQEEIARGEDPDDSDSEETVDIGPDPGPESLKVPDTTTVPTTEDDPDLKATISESLETTNATTDHSPLKTLNVDSETPDMAIIATSTSPNTLWKSALGGFDVLKEQRTCRIHAVPITSSSHESTTAPSLTESHETRPVAHPDNSPPYAASTPSPGTSSARNASMALTTMTIGEASKAPTDSVTVPSASTVGPPNVETLQSHKTKPRSFESTIRPGSSLNSKAGGSTTEGLKQATTTAQAAQAIPSTQESFFKSIHKRLQMLESNATLSLQYIEEQSRILRDAFSKVEKRQIRKTETFLEGLNTTVLAELHLFKQQYDQLWQSTVIELEDHREQYQREILAVSSRLTILADELVFQKRIFIVQSTLLMICLGLVLFTKAGSNTVELPLLQHVFNKSQAAMGTPYYSPPASPSPDQSGHPSGSKRRRRRSFWRSSIAPSASEVDASPDERGSPDGPRLHFEAPTPTGEDAQSRNGESHETDADDGSGGDVSNAEGEDEGTVPRRETQSSPSTPTGTRDGNVLLSEDSDYISRPAGP